MRKYQNPYSEMNADIRKEGTEPIIKHSDNTFYHMERRVAGAAEHYLIDITEPDGLFQMLDELQFEGRTHGDFWSLKKITYWRFIKLYQENDDYKLFELV